MYIQRTFFVQVVGKVFLSIFFIGLLPKQTLQIYFGYIFTRAHPGKNYVYIFACKESFLILNLFIYSQKYDHHCFIMNAIQMFSLVFIFFRVEKCKFKFPNKGGLEKINLLGNLNLKKKISFRMNMDVKVQLSS
eukprot:TRINITY_DN7794_c1_g2_i1.p9 TRINITY_DN7794_c1_g2~~TRINITY_DN7794_c1_g2_i1.p9  ORF type:complete len:134 (+),score=5.13 TRINITY_DN7794_c1_g2_i1:357-758(+)